MRFAFVAPPLRGHLDPMSCLADHLVQRGHDATFIQQADAEHLVRSSKADFRPVGRQTHPPGHLAAITGRLAGSDGLFGLRGVLRDMAAATDMLTRELPDACRALAIDCIVSDQTEAAGGLVARQLGLPFVSVANALPLNGEPGVPPPFVGWQYDPSPWARERNLGAYRVSSWLMGPVQDVIAEHAARWKLGPLRTIEDCASPMAQISQTVPGFDFPRRSLPACFHHVGPLRRNEPEEWSRPVGDRPLAFASLGTLQGGRIGLFRRIAAAAERLDLELVIADGGRLDPEQARGLPGRPTVRSFLPQRAVLAQARLAFLHGGLNTVMDALAAGVPMIVTPVAFEQAAIAARIVRAGAGISLNRRWTGTGGFVRAAERILTDERYGVATQALRREVIDAGGVRLAADLVEQVARTGLPAMRGAAPPQFAAPGQADAPSMTETGDRRKSGSTQDRRGAT